MKLMDAKYQLLSQNAEESKINGMLATKFMEYLKKISNVVYIFKSYIVL